MRMPLASQDQQSIQQCLEAALDEVKSRFAAELISDLQCVNSLVGHIEQYRGKMLRPRLVFLSSIACADADPYPSDAHRVLATVVEMVHMATLVHDDILDDAQVRRRGHTMNQLEGNETAVMLGDYLISHAYHLCSSLDNQIISRAIADTTNTVCEGELLQLANRNNWALDEQTYLEIIRRKTANLCGTCCRLSAMLADSPDVMVRSLYNYGEKVGVAFQIIDDLLDLTGAEDTVGKTLGRDLEKGKLTLPLIRLLATTDEPSRGQMLSILADNGSSVNHEQEARVRRWITDGGAVAYATDWAARLVEQAKLDLDNLPDTPAKEMMSTMADAVLTRQF